MTVYINTSPVTESNPTIHYIEIFKEILWYFYMGHHEKIKNCNNNDIDNIILLKNNSSLRVFCIKTGQWNNNQMHFSKNISIRG